MAESLHDIVEELSRGIANLLSLPETESIDKENIDCGNNGIRSAVGEFVPRISSADSNTWQSALDLVDLVNELITSEVLAVQGLGANSDSKDLVLVLAVDRLDRIKIRSQGTRNPRRELCLAIGSPRYWV